MATDSRLNIYTVFGIFRHVHISPTDLFAALSHDTRLRCMLLLSAYRELCVCELTQAIGASQPHISRHLAHLREAGLVSDRRDGLWIHYRINPELPSWVAALVKQTTRGLSNQDPYHGDLEALTQPSSRESRTRCA